MTVGLQQINTQPVSMVKIRNFWRDRCLRVNCEMFSWRDGAAGVLPGNAGPAPEEWCGQSPMRSIARCRQYC